MQLEAESNYELVLMREGYFQATTGIVTGKKAEKKPMNLNVNLQAIEPNRAIVMNNIHFDLNKYTLKSESYRELDRLADFLRMNPVLKIELNAHTDIRGDYYPNIILSYKRAESTRTYLLDKGVDASRIFANGFGETFPLIKNAKTEAEHERNRRLEFRIIDTNDIKGIRNISQTGFSVLSESPYSEEHPFPSNIDLPEGYAYRVKLGSFPEKASYDAFMGIFPVVQEWDQENNAYTYYAGMFSNPEAAENALGVVEKNLQTTTCVQSYFNNKPVENKQTADKTPNHNAKQPEVKTISTDSHILYSIQIGAFKNTLKPQVIADFHKIAGEYGLYINRYNGNNIYSVGNFTESSKAEEVMRKLKKDGVIRESFIIAFHKGKRIPMQEAMRLTQNH
jgi:outer membrane protein OmpA-like peptidoglycan-associated protein